MSRGDFAGRHRASWKSWTSGSQRIPGWYQNKNLENRKEPSYCTVQHIKVEVKSGSSKLARTLN